MLARNDLDAIVAAWPALARRVMPDNGAVGGRRSGGAHPVVPIDPHVIDVMTEVETWTNFLARVLLEEVPPEHGCAGACHGSAEHSCAGHPCATEDEPIRAAENCPMRRDAVHASLMPDLLAQVAQRVGHFAEHADAMLAMTFCDDAERLRKAVEAAAWPTGRRWVGIGARCVEHGTSDLGERIPCPGKYRVLVDPEQPYRIPDIVCDQDREHRIDPVEWQRAYRRRGEAQAAVDLIARWHEQTARLA